METKIMELDFFEIGHIVYVPYKRKSKLTSKAVYDIIKKYNYPSNEEVDVTRNGITIRYRFANNTIISIL